MESGIDPGQDYYTQDYYSCDHGFVFLYTPHAHTHCAAMPLRLMLPQHRHQGLFWW